MEPHADPYLTIVPDDSFDASVLDTIVDHGDDAVPFSIEPAPAREAAPRRRTSPLVVAGAVGGGLVVGGGVVAAIGLVFMLGLGAVGGATWWWMSAPASVVIDEPVAAVEAPDEEGVAAAETGEPDEEPIEAAGADTDEAADAAPEPAPAEPVTPAAEPAVPTTPQPAPIPAPAAVPAAAAAPPPAATDAGAAPADEVLVKLISDPPGAAVTIDGRSVGRTPLKAFLPAGTHNVGITSGKATGTFPVDPGSAQRFCFKAKGRKVQTTACR